VTRFLAPAFILLSTASLAPAKPRADGFTCTAEASGAGLRAQTQRLLDRRGDLRSGVTTIDLPLTGGTGTLQASWQVRAGLPEVARGRFLFRLPAMPEGSWQLAGAGKPVRARDGVLTLSGDQFSALLAGGAPIQLIQTGRDRRESGRLTLDPDIFAVAVDLARQADARGLAKAYDYRSCTPGN
jgi:hypothetical protein